MLHFLTSILFLLAPRLDIENSAGSGANWGRLLVGYPMGRHGMVLDFPP